MLLIISGYGIKAHWELNAPQKFSHKITILYRNNEQMFLFLSVGDSGHRVSRTAMKLR